MSLFLRSERVHAAMNMAVTLAALQRTLLFTTRSWAHEHDRDFGRQRLNQKQYKFQTHHRDHVCQPGQGQS